MLRLLQFCGQIVHFPMMCYERSGGDDEEVPVKGGDKVGVRLPLTGTCGSPFFETIFIFRFYTYLQVCGWFSHNRSASDHLLERRLV